MATFTSPSSDSSACRETPRDHLSRQIAIATCFTSAAPHRSLITAGIPARSALADIWSGSRRQFDLDYQSAAVARLGVDAALVADGNSADDRQAEAGPSVVGAIGGQPAERFEERRQRGGWDVLA